jgi:cyclopropane fatty-acyl-phospholipid synthase-like methyltransferase
LIETEDTLKLFDDLAGKKVLEIGCGDGFSLEYMSNHGGGY